MLSGHTNTNGRVQVLILGWGACGPIQRQNEKHGLLYICDRKKPSTEKCENELRALKRKGGPFDSCARKRAPGRVDLTTR